MKELVRVVREEGIIFIQAWAMEQGDDSRRAFETSDVFVPWCLQSRFVAGTPEEIQQAGGVYDQARDMVVFQRYCHVYTKGELEQLLIEAGRELAIPVTIQSSWWDKDNWCVIAVRGKR
jgi:alkylated DNA repair protein alkB family protein 8